MSERETPSSLLHFIFLLTNITDFLEMLKIGKTLENFAKTEILLNSSPHEVLNTNIFKQFSTHFLVIDCNF